MNQPSFFESFKYATKIWLTAVVVAPVLYAIGSSINDASGNNGAIYLVVLLVIYGGIFSIPCWLALMIGSFGISQTGWPAPAQKVALIGWGSLLTIGIFWLISHDNSFFGGEMAGLAFVYWIVVGIGIAAYRLPCCKAPVKKITADGPLDQF